MSAIRRLGSTVMFLVCATVVVVAILGFAYALSQAVGLATADILKHSKPGG